MIDSQEVAICRRRGHEAFGFGLGDGWSQCKWCGIWLREVRTTEEREYEPPREEQSSFRGRGATAPLRAADALLLD